MIEGPAALETRAQRLGGRGARDEQGKLRQPVSVTMSPGDGDDDFHSDGGGGSQLLLHSQLVLSHLHHHGPPSVWRPSERSLSAALPLPVPAEGRGQCRHGTSQLLHDTLSSRDE